MYLVHKHIKTLPKFNLNKTQSTTYDASLDEMSTYNEISSNQKQQSLSTDDANQNQTNSVTKINKKKQMI